MTKHMGSETSATDPAVRSQDSAEPSEFPPPSPMACLEIIIMPDERARYSRWIRWKLAFRNFLKS